MSTKIAILKDVIRRIANGEEVDVAKELRVGKTEEEREWEEVMNSFREDAGVGPKEVKEADSNGETLSPITTMNRIQ
ncbi:Putative uncharacterized protein [Taphrina deformans PYCC 5710]|uniref:Uncharacterized protein n=1 Tax=Taphrina deformans (strain PYCC 5710 / ATCC 11124 / CBS 356.35 / IMI 108563 / JCM 9778 / NBRC 8474) TaxID=1097556 RepID=R4X7L7_TAPDE|nr:Putative uncharacterized protein [Taphrina deformans PYCC 5710]|eukprot:CCG81421.1 Putative uncharacterized protein [Taphrina deformans PYCC 5710]